MKFRGLPIEVNAMQWTGDNLIDLQRFAGTDLIYRSGALEITIISPSRRGRLPMQALVGDWIVRGVLGHCYAVEEAAFLKSYEPLEKGLLAA